MDLLTELKRNATVVNSKGGRYYETTYNYNLDIFAGISRYNDEQELIKKYKKALQEDEIVALANLLYILDIREGKGERTIFKTLFKYLCRENKEAALKILPFIGELGRWDYVLEGLDTQIENEVVKLIKDTLEKDKQSEQPTLLAKWLPTHRSHNKNNEQAKKLCKKLNLTEKQYRQMLTELRKKLKLIENNLTKMEYSTIDFEKVPAKAMLKYVKAFERRCPRKYKEYLEKLEKSEAKINTNGLFCYEIINRIMKNGEEDSTIYDAMWKNQKDILKGIDKNILVMADTSASMTTFNNLPFATSIGLAIYIAERNTGIFKDYFLTFSDEPKLAQVVGKTITEKVQNIKTIVANTDIDKAFELLFETAKKNNIPQEELPTHIIIISDMEFDDGVYSKGGTNFEGWKKAFAESGYKLPQIIFWNVAGKIEGLPVTQYENDVIMVAGFSTSILDNLLELENYTPAASMMQKLDKYIKLLMPNRTN